MAVSTAATVAATIIRPRTVLTVVLGSVIMKKMNSWYIGPVSGAISEQRTAYDPAPQHGERDEARHVGQRHMEHANPRGDEQSEAPDHGVRRQVVAPLMAEHGDARRRRQDEQADGEVARIPEVPAAVLQHVL